MLPHCGNTGKGFAVRPVRWTTTLLVCILLLLQACSPPTPPKQIPTIRIGHAPHDHHAPLYIAAMNPDYFKAHGGIYLRQVTFRTEYQLMDHDQVLANVVMSSSAGGEKLIRNLDEGLSDLSFGGTPAILSFIDKGSEMKILLPANTDGAGMVVRPDLPARNWQEFIALSRTAAAPLKIGFKTALSVQVLILEAALRAEQIEFSRNGENKKGARITLVNLAEEKNLLPALENGIVDGFVINQPFVAMAEHKGTGRTLVQLRDLPPAGQWNNTPCCALAGNTAYVAAHPQEVEALMTLLLRANRHISQHPEESARQVAEWLGLDPAVEKLSLPTISFTSDFSTDWNRGVDFWIDNMVAAGKLNNKIKTAKESNTLPDTIYNLELYTRASKKVE